MRSLATHLACLREVAGPTAATVSRAAALGLVAGGVITALALAAAVLLEDLVLERMGLQ